MIIEFTGLPGCGKTYLASELVRRGIVRENMVQKERTVLWFKIIWRIGERIVPLLSPGYRKRLRLLQSAFADAGRQKALFADRDIMYDIKRIAFLRYLYDRYEDKADIYLFDEGILQSFLNIFVYFHIDMKSYISLIGDFLAGNILLIELKTSPGQAYGAIRRRNRHAARFDELQDEELNAFLDRFSGVESVLAPRFCCLSLDREDHTDVHLEKISERIRNL